MCLRKRAKPKLGSPRPGYRSRPQHLFSLTRLLSMVKLRRQFHFCRHSFYPHNHGRRQQKYDQGRVAVMRKKTMMRREVKPYHWGVGGNIRLCPCTLSLRPCLLAFNHSACWWTMCSDILLPALICRQGSSPSSLPHSTIELFLLVLHHFSRIWHPRMAFILDFCKKDVRLFPTDEFTHIPQNTFYIF